MSTSFPKRAGATAALFTLVGVMGAAPQFDANADVATLPEEPCNTTSDCLRNTDAKCENVIGWIVYDPSFTSDEFTVATETRSDAPVPEVQAVLAE